MCLMCEHHLDMCKDPECYAAAEVDPERRWDLYASRSGWKAVLWRGYDEPCDHIKANNPEWRDDLTGVDE